MTRWAWGGLADLVVATLRDCGPHTEAELSDLLGVSQSGMAARLLRLRTPSPQLPKRIHICGWASSHPGRKNHLRPVFAAGNEPDVPRPEAITPQTPRPDRKAIRGRRGVRGVVIPK